MSPREEEVRALWTAARFQDGVALGLELYGGELFGFLHAITKDPTRADDVFAETCAALCAAFPSFRWASSFRTWAYAIARRVWARALRDDPSRRVRPLLTEEEEQLAARAATSTAAFRRTDVKEHVRRLRERLAPEERAILTLRVDRGLSWREVAEVLADGEVDARELDRASAAVRKRFERIVDKLRGWAEADGLLGSAAS